LAKGCHELIRQGAKLVECVEDVLAELGMPAGEAAVPAGRNRSVPVRDDPLLEALGFAPASIDEITARTGRSAAQVAARLAELEIEGRVASLAGGRFQRLAPP
jgi:DNA processing protein